jgi:hypothetical protein
MEALAIVLVTVIALFLFLSADFIYTWRVRSTNAREPGVRHEAFHHHFEPFFSGMRQWGPLRYQFYTNSLGFKDRSPRQVELKTTKYRIVTMGDSFTEGSGFIYDDTWVGLFDRSLNQAKYEVLNMAVASYCPRFYYAKLDYYLKQGLTINEVILLLDISDTPDEVYYEDFPQPTEAVRSGERTLFFSIREQIANHLSLTTTGYNTLRKLFSGRPESARPSPETWASWTVEKNRLDAWGYRGLALGRLSMEKLYRLCKEKNIKVSVAVYPWPQQIRARDLHSIQVGYWRDFCSSHGIPFLDTFPYFINNDGAEEIIKKYFIAGDVHWNAEGNRKMFELVSNFWRSTDNGKRAATDESTRLAANRAAF